MLDSLSNYSKYIATVVGILFVVFCAVTAIVTPTSAVAVDTADMVRDERVGTQHTVSVTLTDLYEEPPLESWTLTGSTALVDVTWTIIQYDQTGAQIDQQSYDGQRLTGTRIAAVDGTNRVIVRVAGTIPRIESFSYDPKQSFRVVSLTQTRTGGSSSVIDIWTATHSTEQSASAREELTTARETVSTVDSDRAKQAQSRMQLMRTMVGSLHLQRDSHQKPRKRRNKLNNRIKCFNTCYMPSLELSSSGVRVGLCIGVGNNGQRINYNK